MCVYRGRSLDAAADPKPGREREREKETTCQSAASTPSARTGIIGFLTRMEISPKAAKVLAN